jgi:hypothetical protein
MNPKLGRVLRDIFALAVVLGVAIAMLFSFRPSVTDGVGVPVAGGVYYNEQKLFILWTLRQYVRVIATKDGIVHFRFINDLSAQGGTNNEIVDIDIEDFNHNFPLRAN